MTARTAKARALGATLFLGACASTAFPDLPGIAFFGAAAPAGTAAAGNAAAPAPAPALVVGESGLAAGIPAAVQAFPDPTEAEAHAALVDAAPLPTVFPRQLPAADRDGEAFADRVAIAPDGRRLLVGTQAGEGFAVQVVGVNRKDVEREVRRRGRFAFVGWADSRTALIGYRRGADLRVERMDVTTGEASTLSERAAPGGVLTVTEDGGAVAAAPGRLRFSCADGVALPTRYDGNAVLQAGPPDRRGRIVFRTVDAPTGVLVPYDCAKGAFDAPLYEGGPFDGALYDSAGGGYVGVWDRQGPRYLDKSLAYEMREVAASFPEGAQVWPIEFTRSPNTVLLYVSGPGTPPSYYVLDRYAGHLDLHVSYDGAR